MDEERARSLLSAERARVQALLDEAAGAGQDDRVAANEQPGDVADRVEAMTAEEVDDAVAAQLRERLAAISRAEQRVAEGTFGRSVRSGALIPEERLEADPAAELTQEEAAAG